jgi:hypothetical protein
MWVKISYEMGEIDKKWQKHVQGMKKLDENPYI